ncbi:hypothetical protein OY671_011711, partial [Metschnikowia pulcherrima]
GVALPRRAGMVSIDRFSYTVIASSHIQERTVRSSPQNAAPADAVKRRKAPAIVCYSVDKIPPYDRQFYEAARQGSTRTAEVIVPPREARTFEVAAGQFFRIVSIEGPQVGDSNSWNAHDLAERFFSGKTRASHATHVSTGDRSWSTSPN